MREYRNGNEVDNSQLRWWVRVRPLSPTRRGPVHPVRGRPGAVHNLFTIIFVKSIAFWFYLWYNIYTKKERGKTK